jgi:O-antigen/teichoic acid export membrane protein
MWWIAEPFITFVYGEKWIQAGAPMSILATAGIFLNVIYPCGVVLAAQNLLGKEMLAQSLNLLLVLAACYYGLNWGLEGVAWGIVLSNALLAVHFYWLVRRALPTRVTDLFKAAAPGLSLSAMLLAVLALLDHALGTHQTSAPLLYLLVLTLCGGLFYAAAFLLIPIPALQTESERWRQKLGGGLAFIRKALP